MHVINRCLELFPDEKIPLDMYMLSIAEACYRLGEIEKAHTVTDRIFENTYDNVEYYLSLNDKFLGYLDIEKRIALHVMSELIRMSMTYNDRDYSAKIQQRMEELGPGLNSRF